MGDPHDGHDEAVIADRVEDPVASLTDTVLVSPRELLTAWWTRVVRQRLDTAHHAPPVLLGRNRFDLLDGGGLDEEPIPCHAA